MKSLLTALTLTTALTLPAIAAAKPVTFTTKVNSYMGPASYLAFYVTDANGKYVGSLWMAGQRTKYYRHLKGWYRATGGDTAQVNGLTGASVGGGRTLQFTLNLSDALFDAGYVLHIDGAVENYYESPNDVQVPLTSSGAGQAVLGRNLVGSFSYSM